MTFAAELGWREKLTTGFVLGALVLAGLLAFGASGGDVSHPKFLWPVALLVGFFVVAVAFRPIGFTIGPAALVVERPFTGWSLPYDDIRAICAPSAIPTMFTIGILRVAGFFGTYGLFWNRPWGVFRMFVTDSARLVEIVRNDGSRVVISPADPRAFRDALMAAARHRGVEIAFAT